MCIASLCELQCFYWICWVIAIVICDCMHTLSVHVSVCVSWESQGILNMSRHVRHIMNHNESLNQPHTVKYVMVKGQSEQWLIKSHSELVTVRRAKAWQRHQKPHWDLEQLRGFTVTPGYTRLHLFLYLLPRFLLFLLPVRDSRLTSCLADFPLYLPENFAVK